MIRQIYVCYLTIKACSSSSAAASESPWTKALESSFDCPAKVQGHFQKASNQELQLRRNWRWEMDVWDADTLVFQNRQELPWPPWWDKYGQIQATGFLPGIVATAFWQVHFLSLPSEMAKFGSQMVPILNMYPYVSCVHLASSCLLVDVALAKETIRFVTRSALVLCSNSCGPNGFPSASDASRNIFDTVRVAASSCAA